ncbi:hypothetical protein DRP53_02945 [candidate division WOR-3 bacterium]|uniref:Transport permease protein n=1 Tax=candidate division WOR-3 bacterium TaxID=2052148 RepID=A0A660SK15_UNCW3|nr:MAG: hypothetical protein DRP53_02945 [candidate division WOR-3 bacterium]
MIRHYLTAINAENIKEWKIEMSYLPDFIRSFIEPIVYVLPFVLYGIALVGGRNSPNLARLVGSGDIITYVVLGYIVMGFLNTACWGMGWSLRKEQWYGTIETIFAAPVPRWVYIAGMATHSTLHQGGMIGIQVIVIHLLFRIFFHTSGILPSLLLIGLMLIALYGMGMMVAALALIFKEGWIVSEILHSIISVVTPIAYPLSVLPVFLREIAKFMPTTYGVLGIRHFLMGERVFFTIPEAVFKLLLFGFVWVGFGITIFLLIDRKVRRDGTLGHY